MTTRDNAHHRKGQARSVVFRPRKVALPPPRAPPSHHQKLALGTPANSRGDVSGDRDVQGSEGVAPDDGAVEKREWQREQLVALKPGHHVGPYRLQVRGLSRTHFVFSLLSSWPEGVPSSKMHLRKRRRIFFVFAARGGAREICRGRGGAIFFRCRGGRIWNASRRHACYSTLFREPVRLNNSQINEGAQNPPAR